MYTISYLIENGKNTCFTLKGCILIDVCVILLVAMFATAAYIDKKNKGRMENSMKHKNTKGKIIYENAVGAVILVYAEDLLYVYEKANGKLIQCFEVPTVEEGVRYLKSL